jgi:hypothetical protein
MKGDERQEQPSVAEPGWYHGVRQAFVPDSWDGGFCVFWLVKMAFCCVLAALNDSTYEVKYASRSRVLRPCKKPILTSHRYSVTTSEVTT